MKRGLQHHRVATICVLALLSLAGALAIGMVAVASGPVALSEAQLRIEPLPTGAGMAMTRLSADGGAVLVPGGRSRAVRARLHLELPQAATDRSRWVLWFPRVAVDELRLQGPGWDGGRKRFFAPAGDDDLLPSGFAFELPDAWSGPVDVELHARGSIRAALRPRLQHQSTTMAAESRGVALTSAVYASLAMLALAALALYTAVHDRAFLAFFAFATTAVVALGAVNGHLYTLPALQWFAFWGAQGIWVLVFLLMAASLYVVMRYADLRDHAPTLWRVLTGFSYAVLAIAVVGLLNLRPTGALMQPVAMVAGPVAASLAAVGCVNAARRGVWMGWPVVLVIAMTAIGALVAELSARGVLPDRIWFRLGYQVLLVLCAGLMSVGLTGRISEYRAQRDRDNLARADSERRLQREASRVALAQKLQTRLRELEPGDVAWTAFRLVLERLSEVMPLQAATVVAYGYHGHDLLLVEPVERKPDVAALVSSRTIMLKGLVNTGTALQLPLAGASAPGSTGPVHAVVPLALRAPSWGALLLERDDPEGFSTEELALAGEFSRLAVLHADETIAALNLRRSAEMDALTGVLNRRTIDHWLARCFSEANQSRQPLSLLFVDIDHFKSINDTRGHACGDHCLRRLAAVLRQAIEPSDVLGRYGGEEFIVLLPGRNGAAARQIAENLRAAVEREEIEWEDRTLRLTVSIGVATRLEQENVPPAALERADKALYAAKRAGRNRVNVAPAVFG